MRLMILAALAALLPSLAGAESCSTPNGQVQLRRVDSTGEEVWLLDGRKLEGAVSEWPKFDERGRWGVIREEPQEIEDRDLRVLRRTYWVRGVNVRKAGGGAFAGTLINGFSDIDMICFGIVDQGRLRSER